MTVHRLIGLTGGLVLAWTALAAVPAAASASAGDGAYRTAGSRITGGTGPRTAAAIRPGQYLDTLAPGRTRWYAVALDSSATADLSVTAAPRIGAAVDYGDGIELTLLDGSGGADSSGGAHTSGGADSSGGSVGSTCDARSVHFGQAEGAMTLTGAVSRIPGQNGDGACDRAGRYLLAVHRTSAAGSDRHDWPVELHYGSRPPLPAGTTPAAARTDYGPAPAPLTGAPKDVVGGTGFNDAARLTPGVWRDRVRPGRTLFYRVHVGWGQQLSYTADFANETAPAAGSGPGFVTSAAYAPDRLPVTSASDARDNRPYDGSPTSVGLGTVPVSWTNRWVDDAAAQGVHQAGDYWIAVGLGPGADPAGGPAVGVVLRVRVSGQELAGPQYRAPALGGPHGAARPAVVAQPPAGRGGGPSGVTGTDLVAAGTGGAVALAAVGAAALIHRVRTRTDRSRA